MKVIVITGSTQGIGFALADSLLALDNSVVLCGRTRNNTTRAVKQLAQRYGKERVAGFQCDVRDPKQVQGLWESARKRFGQVDIWVNNAGLSNMQRQIWQVPTEEIATVVNTNLMGVIYGSQVAAREMLKQGHGAIYNMEGLGSNGHMHAGLVSYGMTKYAVSYFTRGLAKELKDSPLVVGSIRPGMVATKLIFTQFKGRTQEWKRARKIFNIIADRPEIVAPKVAHQMLTNKRTGIVIAYSSYWKLLWRFLSAPFIRRDLFPAEPG